MVAIDGCGGYVPLYRIERETVAAQHGETATGENAVPFHDEDHVTMASDAAETALSRSSVDRGEIGAVYSASVTDPYAEHGISAPVSFRLGLPGSVRTGDFRGSHRAGTDSLSAAMAFVADRGSAVLMVAVDIVPVHSGSGDEISAGAGAGAVVLRPGDGGDAVISDLGVATTGFVERHRTHASSPVDGDPSFEIEAGVRPATASALDSCETPRSAEAGHAIACAPTPRIGGAVLDELGTELETVSTYDRIGKAGVASFLLDVTMLLEDERATGADRTALAAAYGAGGAAVVSLDLATNQESREGATVSELLDHKQYVTYAKHLEYRRSPATGVTAE